MPNQHFSANKIINQSLIFTNKLFFVYKIMITGTDYFYIGYTGDLSNRLTQHMNTIVDAKYEHSENCYPFHLKAAEILSEKFEKNIDLLKYIKKGIRVHVIAITDNSMYAKSVEAMAIRDNISNPNCLNDR